VTTPELIAKLRKLAETAQKDLPYLRKHDAMEKFLAACDTSNIIELLDEIDRQNELLETAKSALEAISDHDTLNGGKYNSYEEAWEGVAEFARAASGRLG